MKKIYATYDPHSKEATLLTDASVEPYVTELVKIFNDNDSDLHLVFAQDIVLLALRVLMSEGKIAHEHVELIYEGVVVPVDSDGRINKWPRGMGDYELNLLSRLC